MYRFDGLPGISMGEGQLDPIFSLPPERRQRLRQTLQKFKQLPAVERVALREKWRNASPTKRRALRRRMKEKFKPAE